MPKTIRYTLLSLRDLLVSAGPFILLTVALLALAYWWILGRGIWVDRMQLRRRVDRCKHPKCSLFTLGLRWIHRLLELHKLPDVALMPVL